MTWQTSKTSAAYCEAYLLVPGQPPRKCSTKETVLVDATRARALLAKGMAAWVARAEWDRVEAGNCGENAALQR